MTRSLVQVNTAPGPTVAEALNGDAPSIFLHRGHTLGSQFPGLIAHGTALAGSDAAIGVVTRLPRHSTNTPTSNRAFLDSCAEAVVRIADPEIHTISGPDQAPGSTQLDTATLYRYARRAPAAPNDAWIREVLDSQHDAGANVLLSASGWVGSVHAQRNLDTQMAFIDATRALLGDEVMVASLTLDTPWLRDQRLLEMLLERLIESPENRWWIRVQWPIPTPSPYSQLRDVQILDGYKELADTAKAEAQTVLLPNTGLTGWVATALGASGFSTGMSGAERAYFVSNQTGGSGNPPLDRYFDKNLLNTLLRADHHAIHRANRAHGHVACTCPYSQRLASGPWSKTTEQLHYLLNCIDLTAQLGRRRRKGNARAIVGQAVTMSGRTSLTREGNPVHLSGWAAALA